PDSIRISYDLQTGSYIDHVKAHKEKHNAYAQEVASILNATMTPINSIMEAGVGECTTLASVVENLSSIPKAIYGFDISLSRMTLGKKWFDANIKANADRHFFVADLFSIPLSDNSVDVVYTS